MLLICINLIVIVKLLRSLLGVLSKLWQRRSLILFYIIVHQLARSSLSSNRSMTHSSIILHFSGGTRHNSFMHGCHACTFSDLLIPNSSILFILLLYLWQALLILSNLLILFLSILLVTPVVRSRSLI